MADASLTARPALLLPNPGNSTPDSENTLNTAKKRVQLKPPPPRIYTYKVAPMVWKVDDYSADAKVPSCRFIGPRGRAKISIFASFVDFMLYSPLEFGNDVEPCLGLSFGDSFSDSPPSNPTADHWLFDRPASKLPEFTSLCKSVARMECHPLVLLDWVREFWKDHPDLPPHFADRLLFIFTPGAQSQTYTRQQRRGE